jgi:Peptidase_C39 like family
MLRALALYVGRSRRHVRLRMLSVIALAVWIPVFFTTFGFDSSGVTRSERYVIPLAPLTLANPPHGWLAHPINFGYRCTLVDAAAVLDYYGAIDPQAMLALELSGATDYQAASGPPWWAYVPPPGSRALLDLGIEQVAAANGIQVQSDTTLGLNFDRAVAAIAENHPVVLNMVRAPDGTTDHSLLAYGYDTRQGHTALLVIDPNTQISWWVNQSTYWSETLTATFITPVSSELAA